MPCRVAPGMSHRGQRLSSATRSSITSAQARSGFWDVSVSRARSLWKGVSSSAWVNHLWKSVGSYKTSNKVTTLDEGYHIPILNANRAITKLHLSAQSMVRSPCQTQHRQSIDAECPTLLIRNTCPTNGWPGLCLLWGLRNSPISRRLK